MVKGVILAGGTGSRLKPLTKVTNKHLLPVYNEPMIYHPLKKMVQAGIKEILIVTGVENAGDFMRLLGSGSDFGVDLTYKIQDKAGGIAQALGLAEQFVGDDKCVVILGDNIFEDDIADYAKNFMKQEKGARIFLKDLSLDEAKRFGIALV
ncbi:MAG: spore coat protein, partial [Candidatus Aenigmarchaeota archaeon CG_4_8_14_3_um_filter_37_24]